MALIATSAKQHQSIEGGNGPRHGKGGWLTVFGKVVLRETCKARGAYYVLTDHDSYSHGKFLLLGRQPSVDVLQQSG